MKNWMFWKRTHPADHDLKRRQKKFGKFLKFARWASSDMSAENQQKALDLIDDAEQWFEQHKKDTNQGGSHGKKAL